MSTREIKFVKLETLYACSGKMFSKEIPCSECRDRACSYNNGFSPDPPLQKLIIYVDINSGKFRATVDDEIADLNNICFDEDGRISEAMIN